MSINGRRTNRGTAWQMRNPNNMWWFHNEINALQNARASNWTEFTNLGTERTELQRARNNLNTVLEENANLSNDMVHTHEVVELNRFRGSRKEEFKDKLDPLKRRVGAFLTHARNNRNTINERITTITQIRESITTLREQQLSDIRFLEDQLEHIRQMMN